MLNHPSLDDKVDLQVQERGQINNLQRLRTSELTAGLLKNVNVVNKHEPKSTKPDRTAILLAALIDL